MTDHRVLHRLAAELGVDLGLPDSHAADLEIAALGAWQGERPAAPSVPATPAPRPGSREAVLASWHLLLDDGRMQTGEPYLAGTRKDPVARLSAATASSIDAKDGTTITVATDRGSITLPLLVTEMPDAVVWLPAFSPGSHVGSSLGAVPGDVVRIAAGGDV
jgi:NADH-quinone oxidoreductase subunit G